MTMSCDYYFMFEFIFYERQNKILDLVGSPLNVCFAYNSWKLKKILNLQKW